MQQHVEVLLNSKFTVKYRAQVKWSSPGYSGNASGYMVLSVDGPGKRAYLKTDIAETSGAASASATVEQIMRGDLDSGYLKKTIATAQGMMTVQVETHRRVANNKVEVCMETKFVYQGREVTQPKQCTTLDYTEYVDRYGEPDARKAAYNVTRDLFGDSEGVDYLGTKNINGVTSECFGGVDSTGQVTAEMCFAVDSHIITRAYIRKADFEFVMEIAEPPQVGTFLEGDFTRVEKA